MNNKILEIIDQETMGLEETVNFLKNSNIDPNTKSYGIPILAIAINVKNYKTALALIEAGADKNDNFTGNISILSFFIISQSFSEKKEKEKFDFFKKIYLAEIDLKIKNGDYSDIENFFIGNFYLGFEHLIQINENIKTNILTHIEKKLIEQQYFNYWLDRSPEIYAYFEYYNEQKTQKNLKNIITKECLNNSEWLIKYEKTKLNLNITNNNLKNIKLTNSKHI